MTLWNEEVARVLREAEAQGWLQEATEPAPQVTYDPAAKRITSSVPIPPLVAREMLERGEAMIDGSGQFVLVEGDPQPPEKRTTHVLRIVVREESREKQ